MVLTCEFGAHRFWVVSRVSENPDTGLKNVMGSACPSISLENEVSAKPGWSGIQSRLVLAPPPCPSLWSFAGRAFATHLYEGDLNSVQRECLHADGHDETTTLRTIGLHFNQQRTSLNLRIRG